MKVVLFCGGQGLRMRDITGAGDDFPKPMVMLGARPMLWHLMKYYAHFGHKDFILCLGYKGTTIKKFFAHYDEWISNDFVVNGIGGKMELLSRDLEDWRITLVDTGAESNIGERLLAVKHLLRDEDVFLANYSDALSNCAVPAVIDRLETTGAIAACLAVRPNISLHFIQYDARGLVKGVLTPEDADVWINGGFFAFRREIFDYIRAGEELVEQPFARLIEAGKLAALPFKGFWRSCDTFKDLRTLEGLLGQGPAPWELWRLASQGSELKSAERPTHLALNPAE